MPFDGGAPKTYTAAHMRVGTIPGTTTTAAMRKHGCRRGGVCALGL